MQGRQVLVGLLLEGTGNLACRGVLGWFCAKMGTHAHGILVQPTWLLSGRLRRGPLPLVCFWFQAHRGLLGLRRRAARAARAAQRGGAARRAFLLDCRGCRCGFLCARSCGCCSGGSLCCALLLPAHKARVSQANMSVNTQNSWLLVPCKAAAAAAETISAMRCSLYNKFPHSQASMLEIACMEKDARRARMSSGVMIEPRLLMWASVACRLRLRDRGVHVTL